MRRPTVVRNIILIRKVRKVKVNEQRNNNKKESRAPRRSKVLQKKWTIKDMFLME